MIIIDELASGKLIHALKTLPDLDSKYCIRFKLTENSAQLRRQLLDVAQRHLPLNGTQMYFCDDGEAFVLADDASIKEYRKTILDVAAALDIHPAERLADLYDLGLQTGALLILLEKKIEQDRKAQEALQKQKEQEHAARKRQEILQVQVSGASQNLAARRRKRSVAELMIIEDDVFSRRLVENVLQKQYRLTGLATAEGALATYASLAPDLLFLDINLPDVSGHELLEKIIAFDPEAYVVMLSGNADKDNIMQAMGRGAKGFIAKPFTRDKLFQYIERCPSIRKENA